jgi:hypothetical protein
LQQKTIIEHGAAAMRATPIDSNTGGKVRNLIVLFFRFWGGQVSTLTTGQIWMLIDR